MKKKLDTKMKQRAVVLFDRIGWALKRRYQNIGSFLALALITLLWVTGTSMFATRSESATASSPTNPTALLDKGRLEYEKGEYEAARLSWEEAGKVYLQQGDRTGVINSQIDQAQALKAQGAYPRAEKLLTETLHNERLQPLPGSREEGLILRSLGDVYRAIGKLDCVPPASEASPPSPAASQNQPAPCGSIDNARTALNRSLEIAKDYPDDRSAVYLSLGLLDQAKFSRIPTTEVAIADDLEPQDQISAALASQTTTIQPALDNFRQARQAANTTAAVQAELNQLSLLVSAIPKYNQLLTAALPVLKKDLLVPIRAAYVQRCYINASPPLPSAGRSTSCETEAVDDTLLDNPGKLIRQTVALTTTLLQGLSQVKPDVQRLSGDRAAIAARINYAHSLMQSQQVADSAAAVNQQLIELLSAIGQNNQSKQTQKRLANIPVDASLFLTNATQLQLQQAVKASSQEAAELLKQAIIDAQALPNPQMEATARVALAELYAKSATSNDQWAAIETLSKQALLLGQDNGAAAITYRAQWQLAEALRKQGNTKAARAACEVGAETLRSLRSDLVQMDQDAQFTFRDSVAPFYRECAATLLPSAEEQKDLTQDAVQHNLEAARNMIESLQLAELDNYLREACIQGRKVPIDTLVEEHPQTAFIYPIILPKQESLPSQQKDLAQQQTRSEQQIGVVVRIPKEPEKQKAVGTADKKASDPLLYSVQTLSEADTIETILHNLREALASRPPRAGDLNKPKIRVLSQKVYNWIIAPFADELQNNNIKTIVFVLDGAFRNIPMAALHDGNGYLVQKYAIVVSPGLQLLAPPATAQAKALKLLVAGLSDKMPPDFAPLPGVKTEFDQMEKLGLITKLQLLELFEDNFTAVALKNKINTEPFNVMHLATHGKFSARREETYIVTHEGKLKIDQLGEILSSRERNRPEAIDLLVLSACETAKGDNRATLGLAGIAIKSGARSTMASLWNVNDETAPLIIEKFYTGLKAHKSKAEALQTAQIEVLKNKEKENPYYWAPYVLVGNWL